MSSQSILILLGLVLGIRSVFILSYLLAYLILDLSIILLNLSRLQFKQIEVLLIILLLITIPVGLLNTPEITRRHLTDFLVPFVFILKISLTRQFLKKDHLFHFFRSKFLKRFIWWSFFSAIVTLVLFYILRNFYPMYLGLTPEIYPFFSYGLLMNNNFFILIAALIIFLSGKRSMLLGMSVIFFVDRLRKRSNRIRLLKLSLFVGLAGFIFLKYYDLNQSTAFNKYKWTVEMILSNLDNPDVFDVVSGGRLTEIKGVYHTMEFYDFFFGKGVGYTYEWFLSDRHSESEHANAHFTPLSIISKYGMPFYCLIMLYVIYYLLRSRKKRRKKDALSLFCFLYVIGINIDFLFAYGFFINKFFPMAIGYLSYKGNNSQK